MTKDFKAEMAKMRERQPRQPVPQVDADAPLNQQEAAAVIRAPIQSAEPQEPVAKLPITVVDTSEQPVSHSFSMYPSRHEQVSRDLTYIEKRHPWQIWEQAMEEYVVKHYGKEYRRK